jgi:hypothetical protein
MLLYSYPRYYIVLEYLTGGDAYFSSLPDSFMHSTLRASLNHYPHPAGELFDRIVESPQGHFTEKHAASIMRQVCRGACCGIPTVSMQGGPGSHTLWGRVEEEDAWLRPVGRGQQWRSAMHAGPASAYVADAANVYVVRAVC